MGFTYYDVEEDVKFVYDTFSEEEAYQLWNYMVNKKHLKPRIQQAYIPMPDKEPLPYDSRSQHCSCGVIDFSIEKDYR